MRAKQAIRQAARIAELKKIGALVTARPPIRLSNDPKRRAAHLLALLAAERRRNAALIEQLRQ